jgi:hypothetical protein
LTPRFPPYWFTEHAAIQVANVLNDRRLPSNEFASSVLQNWAARHDIKKAEEDIFRQRGRVGIFSPTIIDCNLLERYPG